MIIMRSVIWKKIDLFILFKYKFFYICILIKVKVFKFVEWYVERSINFNVFLLD